MIKGLFRLLLPSVLFIPCASHAFNYKKAEAFQALEAVTSVAAFESDIEKYTQECLDNTGGGSGGIPCFIASTLWDRELNSYYKKLMANLPESQKAILQESQIIWIKERDKTIAFNTALLDEKYKSREMGTMSELMRAGDLDNTITPIIKSRVLYLKYWADWVAKTKSEK